jgi:flagellar hook-associated protein 1 FlgK
MSGLFAGLNNGAEALRAYQRALEVAQNNVTNASTPGYARQVATFATQPFQPETGLLGGVLAGDYQSTRNRYLEEAVRLQNELLGTFKGQSQGLVLIEPVFDVSSQSGVSGALSALFQSFSAWSVNPDSVIARQEVLTRARGLASAFQLAASQLASATSSINRSIEANVSEINTLAAQIRDYNVRRSQGAAADAGIDARLHEALENLSEIVDVSARFEDDGSVTVLLGGQSALVVGNRQYEIQTSYADSGVPLYPSATPGAHLLDVNGQDITSFASRGILGGLLTVRNTVLPSLQGDAQQVGALNQLAKKVADRVNQLLQSGETAGGAAGLPLFAYNTASDVSVARSLTLDPNITAAALAPVDPGPPQVSNGIALALAGLGDSRNPADTIGGQTVLEFYGITVADVGRQTADAREGQDVATQSLAQARGFRSRVSGVSIDEEAVRVIEMQRSYQAISKFISILDSLTETLVNMVR